MHWRKFFFEPFLFGQSKKKLEYKSAYKSFIWISREFSSLAKYQINMFMNLFFYM